MSETDIGQRPSRRLWIAAGLAALSLHIGGAAFALSHMKVDEPDEDLGAPAIEIGLDVMSPRKEVTDLSPGPESDASIASPALAEQKAELKQTDLPKDTPTETDDADRIVTPNEVKKPVEEEAKVATVQTQASQESVAAEATSAPSAENVLEGPRSVAPAQGVGEIPQRVRATWQKELMAHLDKHKRYPAERALKSAEILVGFVIDRMGHVLSTSIVKGSGDPAFDAAALDMVRRSDPVPQPPPPIADEGLNFTLPVIFKAKGRS
jgi:protein TonB